MVNTPSELITVVNEHDEVVGAEQRQLVRSHGLIHRIVRVVIRNSSSQILLQQRQSTRSDSPLNWDLSATGHVGAGEGYLEAAQRETTEEIGLTHLKLKLIAKFYSERQKGTGWARRFNALYLGFHNGPATPNPEEVKQVRWVSEHELLEWLQRRPQDFTPSLEEIVLEFRSQLFG